MTSCIQGASRFQPGFAADVAHFSANSTGVSKIRGPNMDLKKARLLL